MPSRKGCKNKHSFKVEEIAHKFGMEPFELLMLWASGDWKKLGYENEIFCAEKGEGDGKQVTLRYVITPEMRLKATEAACKYLYSQKQAVEVSAPEGLKIIIEDYTRNK